MNPIGKSTLTVLRRGYVESFDEEKEVTLTSTRELIVWDLSVEEEEFKFSIP